MRCEGTHKLTQKRLEKLIIMRRRRKLSKDTVSIFRVLHGKRREKEKPIFICVCERERNFLSEALRVLKRSKRFLPTPKKYTNNTIINSTKKS